MNDNYSLTEKTYNYEIERQLAINYANAFSKGLHQCLLLLDCQKRDILFASENVRKLFGIPPEIITKDGYGFFSKYIEEEYLSMIQDISESALKLLKDVIKTDSDKYVLSYDYHIKIGKSKQLVNQKLISLSVDSENDVLLAICIISPITERFSGKINLISYGNEIFYEYNPMRKSWAAKKEIILSEIEKEVLKLTAQGYTANDISNIINKSINTVKYYKRCIFSKMEVERTTEAISYAFNHNIL